MAIKISQELIEDKIKLIFPNYIFDFTNYKNTHSKIGVICNNNHKSEQMVKNIHTLVVKAVLNVINQLVRTLLKSFYREIILIIYLRKNLIIVNI